MVRILRICLLALALSACDRGHEPFVFTANVASYSNIFGFDPIQGPVRSLTQKMLDAKGDTYSEVHAEINEHGCFTTLQIQTPAQDVDLDYVKEGSYLVDNKTKEKQLALNDKCNITQTASGNVKVIINDKGFVTDVKMSESGVTKKHYDYDDNGFPIVDISYDNGKTFKIVTELDAKGKKPFNYKTKIYEDDKFVLSTQRDCQTDSHGNPTSCKIESMEPEGKVIEVYTAIYNTEYY
ncbi:YnfC family lipoprotein [Yersinia aleksiciae]|uniref:YnfC family lipoprotein n=1 Tax=Yersinia aleksiciae TaxID=263819 RepID=UPI0011A71A9A|nr:YnfC family lipoprotein [Yersinia aleksiciae]MDN0121779.1 YnfC family lipoprotein [Yersinia aleksiciae]